MVNAQEWLDKEYQKKQRKTITKLEIDIKDLEGELSLSDFTNLNELSIIKEKQRNWKEFYQWLINNIVDFNCKGLIRAEKRNEYTALSNGGYNSMGILMNALENYIGKVPMDYSWEKKGYHCHDAYKHPFLAYDDNKTFFQLANGQSNSFRCGYIFALPDYQNILNDYEKPLKNWRNYTNENFNIKLRQNQKLKEIEKELEKTRLELVEKEIEIDNLKKQIESKDRQINYVINIQQGHAVIGN